uniref:Protein MICAL 3 n=1 Tax=Echinococcus granulosus TaxID=6210 RepID=A0A068WGU8_ECHGR|nr:protein MICAL 3 [Echinococcus granulosus]
MNAVNTVNYEPIENYFDKFCVSTTFEGIVTAFERLCDAANLGSLPGSGQFYKELRRRLSFYWKAEALFTILDVRFGERIYGGQTICRNIQVLVVGCGPCGLRCAIELALLGANVVIIDKRTSFSRNNVLHLWPYLISDLKSLGAKSFFGKFCAGSIDHISIRTLQCILLKVALLFGVQVVSGVEFHKLIQPSDDTEESDVCSGENGSKTPRCRGERPLRDLFTLYEGKRRARYGWRVEVAPSHEALSTFEFNAIIDATGKSSCCLNFPRRALRCRLAIAITMNFINYGYVEEAHVEEISGVGSIFNQPYFAQISKTLGIELENLVYYKDETHYIVMTIKKRSLLTKGVLIKDLEDPVKLLSAENVNFSALEQLAREVATFVTRGGLRRLDFALNSRGQPDVAVFDFTSLSAAQYACRVVDRKGRPLCQCLVGDALLEPFWPRGSGCALGFLSALDAAWTVSLFAAGHHALRVIAWRDSVYQRLSQTSPSNMPPNFAAYSFLPTARYTCIDLELVRPMQVRHLYDSDVTANMTERKSFAFLRDSVKFDDPDIIPTATISAAKQNDCSFKPTFSPHISLLKWYQQRLSPYPDTLCPPIIDLSAETWADGRALRCLLHKYRSDLVSEEALKMEVAMGVGEVVRLLAEYFGAPSTLVDTTWLQYLDVLHDCLKDHDPAFVANMTVRGQLVAKNGVQQHSFVVASSSDSIRPFNRCIDPLASPRVSSRTRPLLSPRVECRRVNVPMLQRSLENPMARAEPPSTLRAREDASSAVKKGLMAKRRSDLIAMLNDPASARRRSLLIDWERAFEEGGLQPLPSPPRCLLPPRDHQSSNGAASFREKSRDFCAVCKKPLYAAESRAYDGFRLHPNCFRCVECHRTLRPDIAHCLRHQTNPKFYCTAHFHPALTIAEATTSGSRISTRKPVLPKPRAHNTPSLFSQLANPASPPGLRWHSSNNSPMTTEGVERAKPGASAELRRRSAARGIRDEPAPPILLTSRNVPGTLGLPECVRRAAFDERLYRLNGCPSPDDFISNRTSRILDEEEDCFASSENELSDRGLTTSNITSTASESPPMSLDEAKHLCCIMREKNLYRRHHPSTGSSSGSREEEEEKEDDDDDSMSDEDSKLVNMDTFDTPQPISEYENVRWTLVRPPPSPVSSVATNAIGAVSSTSAAEPSLLVRKYGLSGSMLLAKQRFCMADPEPIHIDPRAFRATRNKERTIETTLPDCTEQVEFLPDANLTSLPLAEVGHPSVDGIDFSLTYGLVKVIPPHSSSTQLNVALHTDPVEPLPSLVSLPPCKTDSTASSIMSECVYMRCDPDNFAETNPHAPQGMSDLVPATSVLSCATPSCSSTVQSESVVLEGRRASTSDSTVVSDHNHLLEANPSSPSAIATCSTHTFLNSSSEEEEEEEEEESDDGVEFLQRSVVIPPADLSAQLKENIEQTTRHKGVPMYILTSKLDSDDDQLLMDPQDALGDGEGDEEADTSASSSSDEALPPISDRHAKQIAALETRLSQLEREMQELEVQGMAKERALRELEETTGQSGEHSMTQISSTSAPDLSATTNRSSQREVNSRRRWMRPKRSVHRQSSGTTASRPPALEQEMAERSKRERLLTELLAVISQRNKLVTQEAVIMAELKKIELEAYEATLQQAYDSLRQPDNESIQGRFKVGALRRHGMGWLRKERIFPTNREPARENREQLLLNEIWNISKEKSVLAAVQSEALRRANLQELSVHEVLNRSDAVVHHAFSSTSRNNHHQRHPTPHSVRGH